MNTESNTEFFKSLKIKTYENKYSSFFAAVRHLCFRAANEGKFYAELKLDETNYGSYIPQHELVGADNNRLRILKSEFEDLKQFMQDAYDITGDVYFHDSEIYKNPSFFLLTFKWKQQTSKKSITQTVKVEG